MPDDYEVKDSGQREEFKSGAHRDVIPNKGRFDLCPPGVAKALAIHFEKGANKYGDRNWEKGIPIHSYLRAAEGHLNEFKAGITDENHLISAIWNLHCLYETMLMIQRGQLPKELYTLPYHVKLPEVYDVFRDKQETTGT